jgi:nucleoside-diphosphate-sugar epimerase
VVNIALQSNIQRLIHISSVAALGRTASGGSVTEEKKWEESKVNTHYAKSKHKAELEVWRAIGEGLEAVILNPSTILGYGDWDSSSSAIFKKTYEEFKWYTTGLNSFVDVRDVAKATVLLMETNLNEQRYIVSGDSWHFKKLQDTIAHCFGKKGPIKQATPFLMGIAWRMEKLRSLLTGRKPGITKETVRWAFSKTRFENDKILKALPGFSFTPLEQTIQRACKDYMTSMTNMTNTTPMTNVTDQHS